MRTLIIGFLLVVLHFSGFSQDVFTSHHGARFVPGHLDIVITVDSHQVKYELFNHWYSRSYAELRQVTIHLNDLDRFNQENDTLNIQIYKNVVQLKDARYALDKRIKHRNVCYSVEDMRKISYAQELSESELGLRHFDLYEAEDLKLSEDAFRLKVLNQWDLLKKQTGVYGRHF